MRGAIDADLAYSTMTTVLNRRSEQGLVARRAGRAFAYTVVVDQAEVTARQMQRLREVGGDRVAVLGGFLGVLSDDERVPVERIDEGGAW